jgi:hypothetical protein
VQHVGHSTLVPYRRGEDPKQRNARRLHGNLRYEPQVREWCRKHGFAVRITNEGHHWQLTKDKFVAEWWRPPAPNSSSTSNGTKAIIVMITARRWK